ncbi:MAG: hypothetical protein NUV44_08605, partial [Candidatus Scalindua sp.]|nr:hypothetical protein [Candidatus Scalindua sp.]
RETEEFSHRFSQIQEIKDWKQVLHHCFKEIAIYDSTEINSLLYAEIKWFFHSQQDIFTPLLEKVTMRGIQLLVSIMLIFIALGLISGII